MAGELRKVKFKVKGYILSLYTKLTPVKVEQQGYSQRARDLQLVKESPERLLITSENRTTN